MPSPSSSSPPRNPTHAASPSSRRKLGRVTKSKTASEARGRFIKWFREIGIEDVPLVGGKNASLGEMFRELTGKGVKVPDGFAVTAEGFRYFLRQSELDTKIREILKGLDTRDMENLRQRGARVRHALLAASLPRPRSGDHVRLRPLACLLVATGGRGGAQQCHRGGSARRQRGRTT